MERYFKIIRPSNKKYGTYCYLRELDTVHGNLPSLVKGWGPSEKQEWTLHELASDWCMSQGLVIQTWALSTDQEAFFVTSPGPVII